MEVAFYECSAGDRVRVLVEYGNAWRPIFWVMVRRDGSVYLAPRYKKIGTMRVGSARITDGKVYVKYADGRPVSTPELLKAPKVSFHASGVVHAGDARSFRASLRGIDRPQLLCKVVFQHPSAFAPELEIRPRDILLRYPISEARPVVGEIHVAPEGDPLEIRPLAGAGHQVNLILTYSSLQDTPNMAVRLRFWDGPTGPWPPNSYVLWDMVHAERL
jgi:hypothetical protein